MVVGFYVVGFQEIREVRGIFLELSKRVLRVDILLILRIECDPVGIVCVMVVVFDVGIEIVREVVR